MLFELRSGSNGCNKNRFSECLKLLGEGVKKMFRQFYNWFGHFNEIKMYIKCIYQKRY